AITVHGLDDEILYWNLSSERLYGWSAGEVIGKKSEELLYRPLTHPSPPGGEGRVRGLAEARKLVLEKGEWMGELTQVTRAGKEITVESRWTLVRTDAGQAEGRLLVVNTDATEKKKLEAQF